jgi:hypothetical protein
MKSIKSGSDPATCGATQKPMDRINQVNTLARTNAEAAHVASDARISP